MDRKIILLALAVVLLLSCVVIGFQFIEPVGAATTWTVDDDGPAHYSSIQQAINGASEGDTIFVKIGTYYENVVVNKTVSLIGENRDTTIIDGNASSLEVVTVIKRNVEICNFTFSNSEVGISFDGLEAKNNTLLNCIIDCIGLRSSTGISIQSGSAENRLINNTVKRADLGILIHAGEGSFNILRGNSIIDRAQNILGMGFGIYPRYGEDIQDFVNDIDTSNTIDGKPILYLINQSDLVISPITFPSIGYLGLINCRNITVRDISLECNYQGLLLAYTHNSTIENVKVNYTSTTPASPKQIYLKYSNCNVIQNNTLIGERWMHAVVGIQIALGSSKNYIIANTISKFKTGLEFSSSYNNTAIQNTIIDNIRGISIYYQTCTSNGIYHNNIMNSEGKQVHYGEASASQNVWDNAYEGNYWSDYNGTDTNGDGIGDTELPWWSVDYHPLMGPFSDFPVPYQTKTYHVTTICNSTVTNFNYTPKTISFNVSDQEGTVGFCRIMIPRTLLQEEPYEVLVDGIPVLYSVLPCSNNTHVFLYFTYTHSSHKIVIQGTAYEMPVGGVWTPVNKLDLLAPWIGLASLIAVATISIVYVKHRKKKQT